MKNGDFADAIKDCRKRAVDFIDENLFCLSEPHDDVIELETGGRLIGITQKNVLSEQALTKVSESLRPAVSLLRGRAAVKSTKRPLHNNLSISGSMMPMTDRFPVQMNQGKSFNIRLSCI